jgi:ankyrin repeat protein
MEDLFDVGKPHYAAWLQVYDVDEDWDMSMPNSLNLPRAEPLYYAAQCGFYDLAKHLIAKHPEQVNAKGGLKVTPLAAAVYGNHLQVAELLHQHGADVNVRSGYYNGTLLHAAVVGRPVDTVLWLLNHGTDVNASNEARSTPLHWAASNGLHEIVRVLLLHNADIHAKAAKGEVSLHLVACPFTYAEKDMDEFVPGDRVDFLGTMQLLLDHGADVNARANDGSTPLHYSSFSRSISVLGWNGFMGTVEGSRLLLEHGANIDAENNEGKTPLNVALAVGRQKMVKFLLEHGARGQ